MDTVEIIETEYPLFTEAPNSSNGGEVSEIWLLEYAVFHLRSKISRKKDWIFIDFYHMFY